MQRTKAVIVATVLALGAGSAVYAKEHANDAIADLAQAKITLAQAISAAEHHAGGARATKAELERRKGKTAFEIEVVKGDVVSNVTVDAMDGKVLAIKADSEDRNEREDEDD